MATPEEVEAAVKILREDAVLEHNRQLIARLDRIEQRMDRMPTKEMTAEEKAAEYDRLVAERETRIPKREEMATERSAEPATPTNDGKPPAPEVKSQEKVTASAANGTRHKQGYWDRYQ